MINKSYFPVTILISALLVSTVQAKTFKYEVQGLSSFNGIINYPGLDFNSATSATLTIEQKSQDDIAIITNFSINFLNSDSLSVKNFSGTSTPYKATVNSAWVYRKLNVEIDGFDVNSPSGHGININVLVAEANSFINNDVNVGQPLFFANGFLVDVTPSKVVDTSATKVNGDRLRLSLRSGLKIIPEVSPESQFVINSVWFGNGSEDLYLPSGAPSNLARFLTPYKINLTSVTGSQGDEYFISVSSRDDNGFEIESPQILLQDLLNQAYPPSQL